MNPQRDRHADRCGPMQGIGLGAPIFLMPGLIVVPICVLS